MCREREGRDRRPTEHWDGGPVAARNGGVMVSKIEQDHQRFRQIVQGQDPTRPASSCRGELIGREGGGLSSIPVHRHRHPHVPLRRQLRRVGMGEGRKVSPWAAQGSGREQEGRHILEVDVTMDELADIPRKNSNCLESSRAAKHRITTIRDKYRAFARSDLAALRPFQENVSRALKRQISMGTYDSENR